MKFAQFVAAGIALASAAAFAGGPQRSTQASEQQNAQSPRDHQSQASQGQGAQQDQETIKQAQEKLSSLGHDAGPVDGIVGPKTQAAVKEFQESKGLQASGQLDSQTLAALDTGSSEGAPSARSSGNQSSSGQSMSGQSSSDQSSSGQSMSAQPSGSASASRDTQAATPSSGQQSKY